MRNKYGKYVSVVCAAVLVACAAYGAEKKIKVGALCPEADKYNTEWQRYSRENKMLLEHGMEGALVEQGKTAQETYERFRQFNVIMHAVSMNADTFPRIAPEIDESVKMQREGMEKYVREGGGAIISIGGHLIPGEASLHYVNLLLKGIGVQFREGIDDAEHTFKSRSGGANGGWEYFYTTNISSHPVTEGVKCLYVPRYLRADSRIVALELDNNWKAVVVGEKSCRSYCVRNDGKLDLSKPGKSYKLNPPLAAVRTFGKGRIFIHVIPDRHLLANYQHPHWRQVTETDGDKLGGRPSHGILLAANALKWLAEPSLSIEGFGTYKSKPYVRVKFPASVDWDRLSFDLPDGGVEGFRYPDQQKLKFLPPSTRRIKGIIGVHSPYTDGEGSVKEFADAAREAGLSFIVITDPLEKLTKKEFADLKKDCEAVSDDKFYACPGVEFTDPLGNRWAVWGENTLFPPETFVNKKRTYTLWDGKCLYHTGKYEYLCNHGPNALLDYRTLRKAGGHPENMWSFYRICPFVYEGTELIANNLGEYLFALRDLRWLDPASFTRIRKISDVAKAKNTCVTVLSGSVEDARSWFTHRGNTYNHPTKPYVTQGPEILCWDGINIQVEHPWDKTRGAQRVRLKFMIASDAGIKDVKVHDANYGIVRRFKGNGAKTLAKEFELVHDKQHYLVLEVTDENDRKAISRYLFVFCYKSGFYRCGDNLNFLGSAGLCWHPDRNEMLNLGGDGGVLSEGVSGFDTASLSSGVPGSYTISSDWVYTKEGKYPKIEKAGVTGKILDVKQASYNIQICRMKIDHISESGETKERPVCTMASISREISPIKVYEKTHTAYYLRKGIDFFVAWNYRRAREAAENYHGYAFWHEGTIRFKKDITLSGKVPILLFFFTGPSDPDLRLYDHLFVTDKERGTLGITLQPKDKEFSINGQISPGGYLAAMTTPTGYGAFFSSSDSEFSYDVQDGDKHRAGFDRIYVGLGRDGQEMKAGDEIHYRFMMASPNDLNLSNLMLEDIRRAYNLDGGTSGYPFDIKAGKFLDAQFFFTVQAEKNEALFDIGPRSLICDLAFRIKGIEDNGCAAVYNHSEKYFRFVAVTDNTAYFQESIEKPVKIWAGNPFVCDNKAVRLCLVVDGQAKGKSPFIEVHNPTDKEIKTRVFSPEHTPVFGGISADVTIPAGDSIRLRIDGKIEEGAKQDER